MPLIGAIICAFTHSLTLITQEVPDKKKGLSFLGILCADWANAHKVSFAGSLGTGAALPSISALDAIAYWPAVP